MVISLRIGLIIIGSIIVFSIVDRFGKRLLAAALVKEKKVFGRDHHTLSFEDQQRVETVSGVVNKVGRVVIVIITIAIILSELGIQIEPIIAGAGIIGITIGFGAQSLVRDVLGGLLIVFENQFVKGDIIKVGDLLGEVIDISVRFTVLRDREGVQHYIPNGQLSIVSNYTKSWANLQVKIPVRYNLTYATAVTLLQQVMAGMTSDNTWKHYFLEEPKVSGIEQFENTTVILLITGKVIAHQRWVIERELRKRIKLASEASDTPLCA